ncbi:MAG: N-glycosylase/DNA lyase [Candidatus Aminicenantes bacterium]|nr:N-glycosylase/DNA lyase [Candidatus Aminicenantes bacterium]
MNQLIKKIKKQKQSPISKTVNKRLKEFKELGKKGDNDWFCELCFCILTANSKASTALSIQEELGANGFLCKPQNSLCNCIKRNKHRFYNNKSEYIIEARKYKNIKNILSKEKDPREWLAKNIKGLGWKESSHFLRNVGYFDYAILDRHIIKSLFEHGYIKQKLKNLSKNTYLDIEAQFRSIACKLGMTSAELDLYMWYIETGKVLK